MASLNSGSKSNSGLDIVEGEFENKISEDLAKTKEVFQNIEKSKWGGSSPGWDIAHKVVTKVRPIPWIFWTMIRSAYGRAGVDYLSVDPVNFSVVENMIFRARYELEITKNPDSKLKRNFTESVNILGADTVAAFCFIHALTKRVSNQLSDRIFKAIIEDAFIRARLGLVLSDFSNIIRPGMGLIAGFAGRAGLAVLLSSGKEEQAKRALNGLATGKDITQMGFEVYGCDPLQVAALSLIAGGCHSDIAIGISLFSGKRDDSTLDDEKSLWLATFSAIEHMRIGKFDNISPEILSRLGIIESDIPNLLTSIQLVFRQGHGLGWLKLALSEMAEVK